MIGRCFMCKSLCFKKCSTHSCYLCKYCVHSYDVTCPLCDYYKLENFEVSCFRCSRVCTLKDTRKCKRCSNFCCQDCCENEKCKRCHEKYIECIRALRP